MKLDLDEYRKRGYTTTFEDELEDEDEDRKWALEVLEALEEEMKIPAKGEVFRGAYHEDIDRLNKLGYLPYLYAGHENERDYNGIYAADRGFAENWASYNEASRLGYLLRLFDLDKLEDLRYIPDSEFYGYGGSEPANRDHSKEFGIRILGNIPKKNIEILRIFGPGVLGNIKRRFD